MKKDVKEHGITPALAISLPAVKDTDLPPPKLSTVLTPQGKIKLKALRFPLKQEKKKPKEADSGSSMGQVERPQLMRQSFTSHLKKKEGGAGSGSRMGKPHAPKVPGRPKVPHPPKPLHVTHAPKPGGKSEMAFAQSGLSHILRKKLSHHMESVKFHVKQRFMESDDAVPQSSGRYKVVLISEGLGNLKDGFYYTGEALQAGAPLFEGQKCYANHPSATEEVVLPERDVRDIIGHFENCLAVQNVDHVEIQGELVITPGDAFDWVRAQLDHALEFSNKYQDKDFIGLSINAGGEADPMPIQQFVQSYPIPESCQAKVLEAEADGLNMVRVVKKITEAVSCDLVTQAGAGGRILQAI